MMTRVMPVLAWLVLCPVSASAQALDDRAIGQALRAAQEGKLQQWSTQCKAGVSLSDKRKEGAASWTRDSVHYTGGYQVMVLTSLGRVALFAAEANRQRRSVTVPDVPEQFRTPAVHVIVEPIKPGRDWGSGVEVPSPIKTVLVRSKVAPASAVEPLSIEVSDVQWSEGRTIMMKSKPGGGWEKNLFERSKAAAVMPIDSVRGLPAGALEIVVLTTGADRRCDVKVRERSRLFP